MTGATRESVRVDGPTVFYRVVLLGGLSHSSVRAPYPQRVRTHPERRVKRVLTVSHRVGGRGVLVSGPVWTCRSPEVLTTCQDRCRLPGSPPTVGSPLAERVDRGKEREVQEKRETEE